MTAFKALRDISNDFENTLRSVSSDIFSAKISEPFEDVVAKKKRDLLLYISKLRLLQAKPLACTPQVTELIKNEESTLHNYTEVASQKVIEQQVVKALTQSHIVKKCVTASNRNLNPELAERKEKIQESLSQYSQQESQLRRLEAILKEKEDQLLEARKAWDETLTSLRESRDDTQNTAENSGPLYKKLQTLVDKIELMRWLISKMVVSRTSDYDWATDPHRRLSALALARKPHCIQNYTETI